MNIHLIMALTILAMGLFDRMRGGDYLLFGGLRLGRHIGQIGMPLVAALEATCAALRAELPADKRPKS